MEKRYLVAKNIIYNFGGQITLLVLGIITTPYIIHSLGNDLYAILSLVGVFIGYLSILDLGLGLSIIKYIAEDHAKSDYKGLEKLIGTALVLYLLVGFLGLVVTFLFTNLIVNKFLQIPPEIIPTAITVFYISGIGFLVNMILTVFNAIPNALQRMDISNSRSIFFGVINTLGLLLFLSLNQGLVIIVVWNVLVSLIASLAFFRIVKKLLPDVIFKPQFDIPVFLKLTKFGGYKLIGNIAGQLVFQIDKLLIGFFYPISTVTFYAVPNVLVQKGLTLMLNVNNAIFPAMSQSLTLNDLPRTQSLYIRMNKIIVLMLFPVMAFLFVSSYDILQVWVGQEYALNGSLTLKILSLAYFIAAVSAPGVVATDAAGKPKLSAIFASISAIINLIVAFLLIPKLGIEGAAFAQLISFVAQVPIFLIIVNRTIIKISTFEIITKSMIKPLLAGILSTFMLFLLGQFLGISLINLGIKAVIFVVLYLVLNYLLGVFDDQDKQAIRHFMNKVIKII